MIIDDKNQSILSANITLKDKTDKIICYTYSDEFGKYFLKINKTGQFTISVSSMGYEERSKEIIIENKDEIKTIDFVLTPKVTELKEIIIETKRPITIKKDTIIFNAKSFLQGNEQVVEDLLKKIPGINVSSDGTIKVGNQEVEKIMIDGDDFFEKGYKLLSKNMPVQPVEKVELYQHYSNNRHLKDIEKSNKVALNLKLKDDAKRQWFGNLQLGYGLVSENRYEVRSNLMNFGKKNKYYFLSNLNNTGYNSTGDIIQLIHPYSLDEVESIGDNQSANPLLGLGFDTPNLEQKRVNFNNAEMVSLNSIFTISPKVKLKTLGFFNTDENDFFRNSFQSYSVGNTKFENTENFIGRKTQLTGFGKIDLTYDISKNKTVQYTGKFNSTDEKSRSDLNFNGELLNEKLQSKNQLFDQKLVYTNKFKSNKVVLFSGSYISEKTPQNYSANQFIYQNLFSENANNIAQTSENNMQFLGLDAHLLDRKKNGNLIEIQFGNQFRKDNLLSNFQLKNDESSVAEPLNYQNNLLYSTDDLYLNSKYRLKLKKISLLTQIDFHQLFNNLHTVENTQTQTPLFFNPKIGMDWEINKKNTIVTSYSLNKTNATILDVYTNYIQTGFRSFSKGTGSFNQLDASTVAFNYTYGSWGDKFFANAFVLYTKNHDFFSTNTLVDQNYSQSEKININNKDFLTFSSSIDRYFKPISSNLKITFGGSKSNYKNSVNNSTFREVKNNSFNYGLELRSGYRGIFNYHIGSKWNYNEVITTITNSYTDNMNFLDLSFVMNDKFNFQIQTERYFFGNLDKQNNEYYFMDLEARYTIKENKLTFSLSGNNLFNTATYKNYSITDISISKTEYRLQPRYLLLKMEFRF